MPGPPGARRPSPDSAVPARGPASLVCFTWNARPTLFAVKHVGCPVTRRAFAPACPPKAGCSFRPGSGFSLYPAECFTWNSAPGSRTHSLADAELGEDVVENGILGPLAQEFPKCAKGLLQSRCRAF